MSHASVPMNAKIYPAETIRALTSLRHPPLRCDFVAHAADVMGEREILRIQSDIARLSRRLLDRFGCGIRPRFFHLRGRNHFLLVGSGLRFRLGLVWRRRHFLFGFGFGFGLWRWLDAGWRLGLRLRCHQSNVVHLAWNILHRPERHPVERDQRHNEMESQRYAQRTPHRFLIRHKISPRWRAICRVSSP